MNAKKQGFKIIDEFGKDISTITYLDAKGRVINEFGHDITKMVVKYPKSYKRKTKTKKVVAPRLIKKSEEKRIVEWQSNGYTARLRFKDWGITGRVSYTGKDKNRYIQEIYIPETYFKDEDEYTKEDFFFKMQTTSYGALYGKELDLYLKAVTQAQKAIKVFQKKFDAFIKRYK